MIVSKLSSLPWATWTWIKHNTFPRSSLADLMLSAFLRKHTNLSGCSFLWMTTVAPDSFAVMIGPRNLNCQQTRELKFRLRTKFAKSQPLCVVGLPVPFQIMKMDGSFYETDVLQWGWLSRLQMLAEQPGLTNSILQAGQTKGSGCKWRSQRPASFLFHLFFLSNLYPYIKYCHLFFCFCLVFCSASCLMNSGTVSPMLLG